MQVGVLPSVGNDGHGEASRGAVDHREADATQRNAALEEEAEPALGFWEVFLIYFLL